MLQLFPEYLEQIRQEAIEAYPREAAWAITKAGIRRLRNQAGDPENFVVIGARETAAAVKAGFLGFVHSHTNGKHYPSKADMEGQVASGVPWGIVLTDGVGASMIRWWGGTTAEQVESLTDRTFCHGATDCYSAVRDYYLVTYGILLPEYPRGWEWWLEPGQDLIREGFAAAGFSPITDSPRPGDLWFANLRCERMNHCGVLLENGLTYHQPGAGTPVVSSKKACIQPIYRYLPHVALWVRHRDLA